MLVSVSAHEGLSLAHLEALGAGLPVAATDAGGTREILREHPALTVLPLDASPQRVATAALDLALDPAGFLYSGSAETSGGSLYGYSIATAGTLTPTNNTTVDNLPETLALHTENEMFAQIETVRRAWFSWIDENRETLLRAGQVVHEVAGKVGTFLVAMDQASQHFAATLREVERLADYGWTVPTELTVSELIEFLRSPDADAAAAYLIGRLDATDSDWSQMEARLSGDAHLAEF